MKILFSDIALKAHTGKNIKTAKKIKNKKFLYYKSSVFKLNIDVQNDFIIGHWFVKSYFTHVWQMVPVKTAPTSLGNCYMSADK